MTEFGQAVEHIIKQASRRTEPRVATVFVYSDSLDSQYIGLDFDGRQSTDPASDIYQARIPKSGPFDVQPGDKVLVVPHNGTWVIVGYAHDATNNKLYPPLRTDVIRSPASPDGENALNLETGGVTVGGNNYSLKSLADAGRVMISAGDTADYLNNQLSFIQGLEATIIGAANAETLQVRPNLTLRLPCRVASTANIASLSTLLTVDGVTVSAGDRVLVKDQSTTSQNGIYEAATGAWTRASDFDSAAEGTRGCLVEVTEGSTQSMTLWRQVIPNPTPGTTAMRFVRVDIMDALETARGGTGISASVTKGDLLAGVVADEMAVINAGSNYSVVTYDDDYDEGISWYFAPILMDTDTADKTVASTSSETTLIAGGNYRVFGNQWSVGLAGELRASGYLSSKASGAGTLNIKAKIGGTEIVSTGAVTIADNLSNVRWELRVDFTVRTTGATGTVVAGGSLWVNGVYYGMVKTATTTIDMTAGRDLDLTATWGTADAGNTITCQQMMGTATG